MEKSVRQPTITNKIVVRSIPDDCDLELLWRLLSKVTSYTERGCWIRGYDNTVYTSVKYNGKFRPAHRVSFELFSGLKLRNLGCHHCDVPACINPDHIFDGTNKENIQDAIRKKRRILARKPTVGDRLLREEDRDRQLFRSNHVIKNSGW